MATSAPHNTTICPTVTVENNDPHQYREQIERVAAFAQRVHIDLMDGELAPTHSINLVQVWWPDGIEADIHLMYQHPLEHIETLVSLKPSMVLFHAEAEGDLVAGMLHLQRFGIRAGIGLLAHTQVDHVKELVETADHVLIFSGNLGHFGGMVDVTLLDKVTAIRSLNPGAEIGWDGGINNTNVATLAAGGINVLNVGGYIQRSESPKKAYQTLVDLIR